MPKKKTGQRKKAEKQKLRQKEIRSKVVPLAEVPSNAAMEVSGSKKSLLKQDVRNHSILDHSFLSPHIFSATNARGNKNLVHSAIFVRVCSVCPFVLNVAKWNACWKRAIVWSGIRACSPPDWVWSAQFAISVRRGSVMAENVCNRTHAVAHCRTLSVWNVNARSTSTADAYSTARSALDFYARTTNSNIKHRAKYWNRRTTNVNRAIASDSTRVCVAKHATAMTMSSVRDLSMRKMHQYRVRSVIMRRHKQRIWACRHDHINSVGKALTSTMTTIISFQMRLTHVSFC